MRLFLIAAGALASIAGCAPKTGAPEEAGAARIVGDAAAGREKFVGRGCVICHQVNGVGGKAAPALDAEIGVQSIDPLDFSARMWAGAPAMIELQSIELGYTISLSGADIADLAAFAGSLAEQRKLAAADIPEAMRDSLLDERFWELEDWDEFLKRGQEGYEPEPDPEAAPAPEPTPQ